MRDATQSERPAKQCGSVISSPLCVVLLCICSSYILLHDVKKGARLRCKMDAQKKKDRTRMGRDLCLCLASGIDSSYASPTEKRIRSAALPHDARIRRGPHRFKERTLVSWIDRSPT